MKTISVLLPGFLQVVRNQLLVAFLFLLAPGLVAPSVFGQCTAALEDGSDDGVNVYGWTTLTDHYTDSNDPCFMHFMSFVHSYTSKVTITSPGGRQSSITTGGSNCGGCGVGLSRADGSLAIADEFDAFSISTEEDIDCSVVGLFFTATVTFSLTPSQRRYPNNPWLSTACVVGRDFDYIVVRPDGSTTKHRAQDVAKANNAQQYCDPVYAVEGGTVTRTESNAGPAPVPWPDCQKGSFHYPANFVEVRGNDGYITRYVHMTPAVSAGTVLAGQQIGTLDNSGCQSGPHVHIARYTGGGAAVNFTLPNCTYPNRRGTQFDYHDPTPYFPYIF